MKRVAIVAVAQTQHLRRNREQTLGDLVYAVASAAVKQAGIPRQEIDFTVSGSSDYLEGRPFGFSIALQYMGAWPPIEESHVEMDGAWAAYYAWLRLQTERCRTALVISWGKSSESSLPHVTNTLLDPFYQGPLGLDAVATAALQAQRYMTRFGVTPEQAAAVAVKNRRHALANPNAHVRGEYTAKQVLNSPIVAEPLHVMDCPPISDGACAILMADEEVAKSVCPRPAWVVAVDQRTDTGMLGFRELSELGSCRQAAQRVYTQAGIGDPLRDLDVAEVCDYFTYQELMLYEALGFCRPGEGGRLIESGATALSGQLPVNPSGGVLSANPLMATGLVRLGEAALQVMGQAGERQVPGARRALAHCSFGHCAQGNMVWVLEG